jgi:predicted RND superfamily exporter protein
VRRGCLGVALLFVALAVLFTSATGNLFFLTLLLVSVALLVLTRFVE